MPTRQREFVRHMRDMLPEFRYFRAAAVPVIPAPVE